MIEIKFVGSGGQGAALAAKLLGISASKGGYETQSFASFGYSRRGGTVESYLRISDEKIRIHTKMYEPDQVVLMNEDFAKDCSFLSGLKEGGMVLINSNQRPEQFSFLGNFQIRTIDADRIALDAGLKLPSGLPIINSTMLGAILGITPSIGMENLLEAFIEEGIPFPDKNLEASKRGYEQITSSVAKASVSKEEKPSNASIQQFPAYQTKIAPCEANCPAGEEIQRNISLIRSDMFEEALENIRAKNPFPGTCGRICFHPCERYCNRNHLDNSVAIRTLERAAFDYAHKKAKKTVKKNKTGKRVAVIGSGPAGMACAYFLALSGHDVTIFEALSVLGGIPRVAIPAFRLPRSVIDREIVDIIDLGIKARTETEVGKDIPFEYIMENYDASFIATGAQLSLNLNIPGANSTGVMSGLEFLKDTTLGKKLEIGQRFGVIGGGNTAIDSARTAKRLGAKNVTVFYRRSMEEMPAYRKELEAALKEGIRLLDLTMPVQIHCNGQLVKKMECVKTILGKEDEDGRPLPEPIEGTNFIVEVDTIIAALGEVIHVPFLPNDIKTYQGLVKIDHLGRTSMPGVYAGGDLTSSNRSVVEAIASGKRAAMGIHIDLIRPDEKMANYAGRRNREMNLHISEEREDSGGEVVLFSDLNSSYFSRSPRSQVPELPVVNRSSNFNEVALGLTRSQAVIEAERCFQCGYCNLCGNCYSFCPDVAIAFEREKFVFTHELCKRCGICIEECPRNAIGWKGGS